MLPRSSCETDAGQSAWRKVTLVSPVSVGEMSQLTVVSPQFGKSARPVHLTRLPGTSSSTRIRWGGTAKTEARDRADFRLGLALGGPEGTEPFGGGDRLVNSFGGRLDVDLVHKRSGHASILLKERLN